jgi:hypothetical protein
VIKTRSIEEYLDFLAEKGFHFGEDAKGFIMFGKYYTGAEDELVIIAIEITLKAQKHFDGSFYISLLESLKENNISTKKNAYKYAQKKGLI